jgi:hypothetical protein
MNLDKFIGLVRDFLAVLGIVACAALMGLWQADFFTWAAKTMPHLFGWLA